MRFEDYFTHYGYPQRELEQLRRLEDQKRCQHEWTDQAICRKCGKVDPHEN